jgi:competence protein ComEA
VAFSPGGRSAVVHVAGAVRRPGVYQLGPGARVQDAVRRAGGPRRGADLDAVNLAARVADGQQIVVPRTAAATAPVAAGGDPGAGTAPSAPVSLGSATLDQLQTLDGVGPATAQKIVAYRTEHGGFRSVDDLANVPGIGPKKLAAIKPHVQP